MPIPEFLQPWLGSSTQAAVLFYTVAGGFVVVVLLGLWQLLGRGPRRRRAYHRARRLLQQGTWQPALDLIHEVQRRGGHSPRWQELLRRAEGECHRAAGLAALQEKRYERGLELLLKACPLLGTSEVETRAQLVETMLAEVRRLMAADSKAGTDAIHPLLGRIVLLQPGCLEAFFWQGLCHVRDGNTELALSSLRQARGVEESGTRSAEPGSAPRSALRAPLFLDPLLYLGALLIRSGRPDEALRYLAEANRLDANCPFVTWQLGTAMLAASGDGQIAVRALQRALGARGLQMWAKNSARVWVEAFPEKASYVRRLATRHPFLCPLFGGDVGMMIRQGQVTLGQGQYRLGNFEESAKVFNHLLQEGAPSLLVLRGLGLALARLDRFDEAFKHLRTAHEMEDPKDFLTAGYLALCGARGKPTRPEDRGRNVLWAVRLACRFDVPNNPEWANLLNLIFAEARALDLPLALEEQTRLCDTLVSVAATDPLAAAAYGQLAAMLVGPACRAGPGEEVPLGKRDLPPFAATLSEVEGGGQKEEGREEVRRQSALRPEYAWLYCRAAQQHDFSSAVDLEMFARTFATRAEGSAYFAQHEWDFEAVEFTFLQRCAAQRPGDFPAVLGADYAERGERLLLERSRQLEQQSDLAGAMASAEVLQKLAPRAPAVYDRLAYLAYRAGDLERATHLLHNWHLLTPEDHWPFVRRAVIEQQRGNHAGRAEAMGQALARATGKVRADVAFLGARLALQEWLAPSAAPAEAEGRNGESKPPAPLFPDDPGRQVLALLNECLQDNPEHEAGLWCRAAVYAVLGRHEDLVTQAAVMRRLEEGAAPRAARFHFLAAVCHLAAGDYPQVHESAGKAEARDPALAVECGYLKGWAALLREDRVSAVAALRPPALDARSPSHRHAQALLGKVCFDQGAYDQAVSWWKALEAARRGEWGLDEPLRNTLLASALRGFQEGQFEKAADRLRDAGRLGLRDRRLGPLLALALLKAGQRVLYSSQ